MLFSIFLVQLSITSIIDWGEKERITPQQRKRKLDPLNQFFLTLVKLKLNLKHTDLGFRFRLSASQTSWYLTTWICFFYNHLKEINWMPAVDQVMGTLPAAFRDKFLTTYAIIDGSEVFIETPSDLHLQSSTWSQYKHHNTVKFLVACTPNGAIYMFHFTGLCRVSIRKTTNTKQRFSWCLKRQTWGGDNGW